MSRPACAAARIGGGAPVAPVNAQEEVLAMPEMIVFAESAAYNTGLVIGYVGTILSICLVLYRRHRR